MHSDPCPKILVDSGFWENQIRILFYIFYIQIWVPLTLKFLAILFLSSNISNMFFSRVVVYHVTIVTSGHWEKFSAVSVMTGEKEVGSQVRTKLSYNIFFCKIYKFTAFPNNSHRKNIFLVFFFMFLDAENHVSWKLGFPRWTDRCKVCICILSTFHNHLCIHILCVQEVVTHFVW